MHRIARRFRRGLSLLPFLCGACQAGLALDDYSFGGAGGSESSSPNGQGGSSSGGGNAGSGGGAGAMATAGAQSSPTAGSGGSSGTGGAGGASGVAGPDAGTSDAGGEPPDEPDPEQPTPCNPRDTACGVGRFCDAPDCDSNGVCATAPTTSSPTMAPACGCNGTTYWNSTHAQWLGTTAFTVTNSGCPGEGEYDDCSVDSDCDATGAACVTDHGLGKATCTNAVRGVCWAIPNNASCDGAPSNGVGFGSCPNGPDMCTGAALELCPAVLDGNFYAICL